MSHSHLVTLSPCHSAKQFTSIIILLLIFSFPAISQVAINTTGADADASAILDISSTEKGMLVPRMTTVQRTAITSPANGLLVYDTDTKSFWSYNNDDALWVEVVSGTLELNDLSDAVSDDHSVFVGFNSGISDDGYNFNTGFGNRALRDVTEGTYNTAVGSIALMETETGNNNTAMGYRSMAYNITGEGNVAIGVAANSVDYDGDSSVFVGMKSGFSLNGTLNCGYGYGSLAYIVGDRNTAIGSLAGFGVLSGSNPNFDGCIFLGYEAGRNNTADDKLYIENSDSDTPLIGGDFSIDQVDINGTIKITGGTPGTGKVLTSDADGLASWEDNPGATSLNGLSDAKTSQYSIFLGNGSGHTETLSSYNSSVGISSLWSLTNYGATNTAMGYSSSAYTSDGDENSSFGARSLLYNETGSMNTAIGTSAGYGSIGNSFSGCIFLGYKAGKDNTSDNKLYIDNSDTINPLIGGDFSTNQVDINGTIKITGGTPGNGKILTSDADGLASWENNPGATELNDLSDAITGVSMFIGDNAGINNSGNGVGNTSVGYSTLRANTFGHWNTVLGTQSMFQNTTGTYNTAVGSRSMYSNISGSENTTNGFYTLYNNETGNNNTVIGYSAGQGTSGNSFSGCVLIGHEAGKNNSLNNKLFIENSDSPTPLIGGDFSTNQVDINGTIKITGGNPGTGKILTSDADGLASWEENLGATELNELSDAKTYGSSVFIGTNSGSSNTGSSNSALGCNSLEHNTIGMCNTALGDGALPSNISGDFNVAVGSYAAVSNTTGDFNTAIGVYCLYSNTIGFGNTALGDYAHYNNTEGSNNLALGGFSLQYNVTGSNNTAVGTYAGVGSSGSSFSGCVFLGHMAGSNNTFDNKLYIDNSEDSTPLIGGDFSTDQVDINGTIKITGGSPGNDKVLTSDADGLASWQTPATYASEIDELSDAVYNGSDLFLGNDAGISNSGSNSGVALGPNALNANTTSEFNTAIGFSSLDGNTGERNTAVGSHSLGANTTGERNTSIGYSSGVNNSTGSYNTFIGYRTKVQATATKDNSTAIGNEAIITASNQVRIGNASVTSIGGQVSWTTLSDGRFKENVKEDVAGLDFVLNLRPVSYIVNKQAFKNFVGSEYEGNNRNSSQRECGFVAQEVEKLIQKTGVEFNGVDAPENSDDYYGIRYSQFVMPLVVSVQELNEKLEKENAEQTTEIEKLKEENEDLKIRLQKLESIILKK